jgi:hypothetical protein
MKSDWLDKLSCGDIYDKAPSGFYTFNQIMYAKGFSQRQAIKILRAEIEAGRIKTIKVRIRTGQKSYPVPHYGPA